jgi:hypothetical protein
MNKRMAASVILKTLWKGAVTYSSNSSSQNYVTSYQNYPDIFEFGTMAFYLKQFSNQHFNISDLPSIIAKIMSRALA